MRVFYQFVLQISVKLWKTNTVLKIVVVMLQSNLKEKFLWYSFVDIHGTNAMNAVPRQ